jgi:hypothetical protein
MFASASTAKGNDRLRQDKKQQEDKGNPQGFRTGVSWLSF